MALTELRSLVAAPQHPVEVGDGLQWGLVEDAFGILFPEDYREYAMLYGSGKFRDESIEIVVFNPCAKAYVEREEAQLGDAIERVRKAGGIPSVAHPVRIFGNNYERVDALIRQMADRGLMAVEAYHSDHKAKDVAHYTELARSLGLGITGGSDFHGAYKPKIKLGTGLACNLAIPYQVLEDLMSST